MSRATNSRCSHFLCALTSSRCAPDGMVNQFETRPLRHHYGLTKVLHVLYSMRLYEPSSCCLKYAVYPPGLPTRCFDRKTV